MRAKTAHQSRRLRAARAPRPAGGSKYAAAARVPWLANPRLPELACGAISELILRFTVSIDPVGPLPSKGGKGFTGDSESTDRIMRLGREGNELRPSSSIRGDFFLWATRPGADGVSARCGKRGENMLLSELHKKFILSLQTVSENSLARYISCRGLRLCRMVAVRVEADS
jgi:hypothetical protein